MVLSGLCQLAGLACRQLLRAQIFVKLVSPVSTFKVQAQGGVTSASPEAICGKNQELIIIPHWSLYHIRGCLQKVPCYVFGVCKVLIPPLLTAQRTYALDSSASE